MPGQAEELTKNWRTFSIFHSFYSFFHCIKEEILKGVKRTKKRGVEGRRSLGKPLRRHPGIRGQVYHTGERRSLSISVASVAALRSELAAASL